LLDTAQEFGRLGVWERKIPSGEGRWDRHVFRFFGMDPGDGTPHFEIASQRIHPDDRSRANYPLSTRQAGRYEARYRVLLPDGSVQRIHSQWEVKNSPAGVPERTVGIMVDDTETYQLAQAFNDTSEQLRLAVDLGNIAIWRQDLRTNRLHYNYRAYQVLDIAPRPEGLSLEEVRALIHPDDLPRVIAAARTALDADRPVDMEARYRRSDGSWRYVLTRRVLRRDARAQPLEFVGVALDVTEQVEKSRRANELAQAAGNRDAFGGLGHLQPRPGHRGRRMEHRDVPPHGPRPSSACRRATSGRDHHPSRRPRADARVRASGSSPRATRRRGAVPRRLARRRGALAAQPRAPRARNGAPTVFGITIDVTDRVRTEARLRGANERVALTARSVGLGTWEWDPATDTSAGTTQMYRLRGASRRGRAPTARAGARWPTPTTAIASMPCCATRWRSAAAPPTSSASSGPTVGALAGVALDAGAPTRTAACATSASTGTSPTRRRRDRAARAHARAARERGEVAVPRPHEPRAAHAAERGARLRAAAAARRGAALAEQRAAASSTSSPPASTCCR
jgi:PAS domain S-box-containing protein